MNLDSTEGHNLAQLAKSLVLRQETLAVAESCTGGGLGQRCTDLSGSSAWFEGGVIAYSNRIKQNVLAVNAALLEAHGAVSEPVVIAMALGVKKLIATDWAVSISGIAGPDGGSVDKPVGTVCLGFAGPDLEMAKTYHFPGDRLEVREQAISAAIDQLLTLFVDGN